MADVVVIESGACSVHPQNTFTARAPLLPAKQYVPPCHGGMFKDGSFLPRDADGERSRLGSIPSRTVLDIVGVCGKQFTHYTTFARNDIHARMSNGSTCGVSGNVNIQDLI